MERAVQGEVDGRSIGIEHKVLLNIFTHVLI